MEIERIISKAREEFPPSQIDVIVTRHRHPSGIACRYAADTFDFGKEKHQLGISYLAVTPGGGDEEWLMKSFSNCESKKNILFCGYEPPKKVCDFLGESSHGHTWYVLPTHPYYPKCIMAWAFFHGFNKPMPMLIDDIAQSVYHKKPEKTNLWYGLEASMAYDDFRAIHEYIDDSKKLVLLGQQLKNRIEDSIKALRPQYFQLGDGNFVASHAPFLHVDVAWQLIVIASDSTHNKLNLSVIYHRMEDGKYNILIRGSTREVLEPVAKQFGVEIKTLNYYYDSNIVRYVEFVSPFRPWGLGLVDNVNIKE